MPSREVRAQRRAKAYGYDGEHFSLEEWEGLLASCGHRCLACGATEDLSVDHIHPLSLGGSNEITNLQVLCCECNSLKGDAILDYRVVNA
jgi:5-methylcytosine-specific restriction endonuclease McrA